MQLVLSLFPGIGLLDMAFEQEGFCVVRGPDVLWGGDIRRFHPPAGKFDGVIGGPPCQAFSEANGINNRNSKRENLIPEFERCIAECRPRWFVMENVRRAPLPNVVPYEVADYLLNGRWFGMEQKRIRRFSFGHWARRVPLLIEPTIKRANFVARTVLASDGRRAGKGGTRRGREHNLERQVHTFADAVRYQGLPEGFLEHSPFTVQGRWIAVGNGVPLPMGRAIARAVKEATEGTDGR